MLALLAAIAGDEPRCAELASSALRQFAAEEVANVSTMAEWALALLDLGLGRYGAALSRFEMTATGPLRHYIQPILFAPDQIEAAVRFGPAAGADASAVDRAAEPLARFAAWAGPPVSHGRGPCCTAAGPSPRTVTRRSITARRCGSTRSAAVRSSTAAPNCSTANGWAAAAGARTPASTCEPRSRSSTGPGPLPGPNGPGPSCARRGSPRPPGRRRRTG